MAALLETALLPGCYLVHSPRSGPEDAGRVTDAHHDAPSDAGFDAGFDAGPPECVSDVGCDDENECTHDSCEEGRCLSTPDPARCELFVQHTLRTLSGAHSIEAVDLDLDTDLDLVCAAHEAGAFFWAENEDGAAQTWGFHHLAHATEAPRRLIATDLDLDGDPDLVGGGGDDDPNDVLFFRNEGGRPLVFTATPIADREVQDLAAGDLDGDGDIDVVGVSQLDTWEIYAFRQGADGSFHTETLVESFGSYPQSIALADLDRDGRLDLLVAALELGWFPAAVDYRANTLGMSGTTAEAVDMDGDEDLDVLAGWTDTVAWFENLDGVLGSTRMHTLSTDFGAFAGFGVWSVHAADIDDDGDVDVLVAARDTAVFSLLLNQGAGRWTRIDLGTDIRGAFDVTSGDLDGDGDLDVAGAARDEGVFLWWENLGRL